MGDIILVDWDEKQIKDLQDWLASPQCIALRFTTEYTCSASTGGRRSLMNRLQLFYRRVIFGENATLARIESKLDQLLERQETIMTDLTHINSSVAGAASAMEGAATLINGLAALIRDNLTDPAALEALASKLDTDRDQLAAAIFEGTAAENLATSGTVAAQVPADTGDGGASGATETGTETGTDTSGASDTGGAAEGTDA